ncbi:hypothetical protein PJP07_30435, partial [Mycobacterium kansasii]
MVAPLHHYDVILGMDWLAEVKAEIDCDTRAVTVHGHDGSDFTFPVQVSWYYRVSSYATLLVSVEGPMLGSTPVVQDFAGVF